MPAIFDRISCRIFASLCQGVSAHLNKHLAENLRSTLGYHKGTIFNIRVRVPCCYGDTHVCCFLQGIGHACSINGGNADRIYAAVDRLMDNFCLLSSAGNSIAHVLNGNAPFFGIRLSAIVRGLKECISGYLRDECNSQAFNRLCHNAHAHSRNYGCCQ